MKHEHGSVVEFDEWQPLWKNNTLWITLALILAAILVTFVVALGPSGLLLFGIVLLLFAPVCILMLFPGMRTVLSEKGLLITMKPFVWALTVTLHGVTEVTVERYRAVGDYWGWGIRRNKRGWAYTISGDRGVRLHYGERESVLIGSHRPEELAEAIRKWLETSND